MLAQPFFLGVMILKSLMHAHHCLRNQSSPAQLSPPWSNKLESRKPYLRPETLAFLSPALRY